MVILIDLEETFFLKMVKHHTKLFLGKTHIIISFTLSKLYC